MKILQINAVGQIGSTGRNCKELADYIHKDTEHTCYTAFAQGEDTSHAFQIGGLWGWKLHGLLSRITGKQAHFSGFSTRKLLKRMDVLKPDVVVLNNLHGNYIHFPMLMRYLAKKNIATVAVLHDCWFFTGKCTHYTIAECTHWETGCHDCPQLKNDNVSWLLDATSALWEEKKELFSALPRLAVVGVSDWITNEAKKSYLSCAKIVQRIYNWIDLEMFQPRENIALVREQLGVAEKKVILGVASSWGAAKGLENFKQLAVQLGEEYTVVLVGHMPEDIQLPSNLISVSPTNSVEELAQYYSMANVFVTMSLQESFGKVSAEALACGTPVVCFDSTANKELVGDGCGKVLPIGDVAGVADAVKTICSNGKDAYTQCCRDFATENFSKNDCIEQYIALFEKILTATE